MKTNRIFLIVAFAMPLCMMASSCFCNPFLQQNEDFSFARTGKNQFYGFNTSNKLSENSPPVFKGKSYPKNGEITAFPEIFEETLFAGEKKETILTLTNNLETPVNYQLNANYGAFLESLGWNYGSTPFGPEDGIFAGERDQAMFIKDIILPSFTQATLYLGFDDGCRVWINGQLAFDYIHEVHSVNYWEYENDISAWLQEGQNRISVAVFNGVFDGGYPGGFDCQLTVDGVDIIKRGDQNEGEPEAMWHYYGESAMTLVPPDDINGLKWWEFDYGKYKWLLLAKSSGQQFTSLGWNYWSTPIFENPEILYIPPDNAQFVRDIFIDDYFYNATLYLGFDDGCRVWINGVLMIDFHTGDHGLDYWNEVVDISGILVPGRNRIAVEVYNGLWAGAAYGAFDCQLTVDGVDLIKRGDENPGEPETMWYVYGEAGQVLTPPSDNFGHMWFGKDYGLYDDQPSTSLTGTIESGDIENIKVLIYTAGLTSGSYNTSINVSYDQMKGAFEIPVNLDLTAGAFCFISPSILDYGVVYYGMPETQKLRISNQGEEPLYINDIYSDYGGVEVDNTNFSLEPGESEEINVTFSTEYEFSIIENLYIDSDDPLQPVRTVLLMAYGQYAPQLAINNVQYLWALLGPDQTITQNLHIENWGGGGSVLNFSLPQGQLLKKQNDNTLKPALKSKNPTKMFSGQMINRPSPQYYTSDILAHKNLVINKENGKSGIASEIVLFSDDMESGTNNWTIINYRLTEIQWHRVNFNFYSPSTSWWCGDETSGTYQNDSIVQEAIITSEIALPNFECPITLEFNEWWLVEGGYDQCFVDISTDGGNNWDRIRENIPGSSEGWITTSLDLSSYWNQTVKIRFLFDTGDDVANDFPGWFIDDVRIYFDGPDFLSVTPVGGSIPGGQGFDISVTFDATGYDPGFYPGFVLILSNDPNQPQYYLPAYMEVGGRQLNLKTALEGPYYFDGSTYMKTDLNTILPLSQPYNVSPWNYTGTESVISIPNTDIVDWVLLEFRDAPDAESATPVTTVGKRAAFLRNNGMIVDLDGYSRVPIDYTINNLLFVAVWQRNHLGIMTSGPIVPAGNFYDYDFTNGVEKAYGTEAQKDIGNGFFGMYSGDLDANGTINSNDKTDRWKIQAGKAGYLQGDANMDQQTNNNDKIHFWLPNVGKSCQVP
jgi:hypothetical protein